MYKVDFFGDKIYEWEKTKAGADFNLKTGYRPSFYVSGRHLDFLKENIDKYPSFVSSEFDRCKTDWNKPRQTVLCVETQKIGDIKNIVYSIRKNTDPHRYEFYNIDFSPQFRYCLENSINPKPKNKLKTSKIKTSKKKLSDRDISKLEISDKKYREKEKTILKTLQNHLKTYDPDILVLSHGELVPLLYEKAEKYGLEDFELGRIEGHQKLAGESSHESYGRICNSPARYNIPGRCIIDLSNCFWWDETNLYGMLYLVKKSQKPIQELAWSSIGNILTSIQIRYALNNDVLVPWKSWNTHEQYKSMKTLHSADRGGHIFSPKTGVFRDVYEADFSSLYPKIMIRNNISPETIRCSCHKDRKDVPELGYNICDKKGFIPKTLEPLVEKRDNIKKHIDRSTDKRSIEKLEGISSAIKWALVCCFGYLSANHSRWGNISCHEAINAYARKILIDTKQQFEEHGYKMIHGIIDSIWVQPRMDNPTPIEEVCRKVSSDVGIGLDFENSYSWIAFCPRRNSNTGALTRYFGKIKNKDGFKIRGIETRQCSTPPFIEEFQHRLLREIDSIDSHKNIESVFGILERYIDRICSGCVDPEMLVVKKRISKSREEYQQYTRNVAALDRTQHKNYNISPGEDAEYVVVDDDKKTHKRVRLAFEDIDSYDIEYYVEELLRATETILSPFGWNKKDIEDYLSSMENTKLTKYNTQ